MGKGSPHLCLQFPSASITTRTNLVFNSGSERGIVGGTDQSDTELENLSSDSGHIHKKVDYTVKIEEGSEGNQLHNFDDPCRVTNKSWVDA
jgi:hypothetical protein